MARSGSFWSRRTCATCVRIRLSSTGEAISQKVIGRLLAGTVDRVITVDAHLHRTTDIRERVSRHRGRQPLGHAGDRRSRCAPPDSTRGRSSSVRMPKSGPWVSDLAERLGADLRCRAEDASQRSFGRSRVCRSRIVRRPSRPAGRRYRLVGRHVDRLRQSARGSRRRSGRRHRHACTVRYRSWPPSSSAPAFAPSVRQTACRIRPMRSRSMTPTSPHCAARSAERICRRATS